MVTNREAVMRKAYSDFSAGDFESVRQLLADDVVWIVPGRNQLSATYRGPQEVLGSFAKLGELTAGDVTVEPIDIAASDTYGYALMQETGTRPDGRSISQHELHVWKFTGDKVSEFRVLPADQYVEDEFWS